MIAPNENIGGRPRETGGLIAAFASLKKVKFVYGKCSMSSNVEATCPLCGVKFTGKHFCEVKGGKCNS